MDIIAYNNEGFVASFDVTAFLTAYELPGVSWAMQVRRTVESAPVHLEMSTLRGNVYYDAGVVTFAADMADMKN